MRTNEQESGQEGRVYLGLGIANDLTRQLDRDLLPYELVGQGDDDDGWLQVVLVVGLGHGRDDRQVEVLEHVRVAGLRPLVNVGHVDDEERGVRLVRAVDVLGRAPVEAGVGVLDEVEEDVNIARVGLVLGGEARRRHERLVVLGPCELAKRALLSGSERRAGRGASERTLGAG